MMKILSFLFGIATLASAQLSAETAQALLETTPVPSNSIDLMKVFLSCPVIYAILLLLSIAALSIWIYSMLTLRLTELMPKEFIQNLRELLTEKRYEAAVNLCQESPNFTSNIISTAISNRKHGHQVMVDAMQAEGRRSGSLFWRRISLLNEIAAIAPMVGLLGTVVGLFFAFYDTSRSAESLVSIFDGLGIAIGTTVAGLIVALIAMICYTTLRFRVMNVLDSVENESLGLVSLVDATPVPQAVKA